MVVCPTCREMNDEDRAMCQRCGSSLEANAVTLMPRRADGERPAIEVRKPPPPSKWRPIVLLGVLGGLVAGFADATGRFLPLSCTLNAARVLDAAARMLGVTHDRFADLALSAPPGSDGLVLVPYLEGERTPNLPDATGALHGLRLANATPAHQARAAVEGMLCGLADALDALVAQGVRTERVLLVGGGARSAAVRAIAPTIFGRPVLVPEPGEYVADGAARQAAWTLAGGDGPPAWRLGGMSTMDGEPAPWVRERYAEARDKILSR